VAGEGGRIAIAGGAGGLARWLNAERRRVRDGVIAAAGGLVAGTYLWPLVLAVIGVPFGGLDETPNNIAMAAFVAGALGMSIVKVITAMVEARIKSAAGERDDA
jgi:hypothetical protein